jgi:transcriptional regulator with XRE-family HTH domain
MSRVDREKLARLIKLEIAKGIGVRKLAGKLRVSPASLYDYLERAVTPTMATLEHIAEYFEIGVHELFVNPGVTTEPTVDHDEARVLELYCTLKSISPDRAAEFVRFLEFSISQARRTDDRHGLPAKRGTRK